MKKLILAAAAVSMLTGTANAEVGFGAVLSINTKGEISVGPRVFTTKRAKKFTGTAGINYNFKSKGLEAVFGGGYTLKDGYVGGEIAYSLKDKKVNFGASGGWSNAKKTCEDGFVMTPTGCSEIL